MIILAKEYSDKMTDNERVHLFERLAIYAREAGIQPRWGMHESLEGEWEIYPFYKDDAPYPSAKVSPGIVLETFVHGYLNALGFDSGGNRNTL